MVSKLRLRRCRPGVQRVGRAIDLAGSAQRLASEPAWIFHVPVSHKGTRLAPTTGALSEGMHKMPRGRLSGTTLAILLPLR